MITNQNKKDNRDLLTSNPPNNSDYFFTRIFHNDFRIINTLTILHN